jgi:hypothetical protein
MNEVSLFRLYVLRVLGLRYPLRMLPVLLWEVFAHYAKASGDQWR